MCEASAWGAATQGFFCGNRIWTEHRGRAVAAQAGQSLPPVTVDAPKPQTAAARPTCRRQAARSQGRRDRPRRPHGRQTCSRRSRGFVGQRGLGPVDGYLANDSVTGTKTDTPLLTTPQSISVVTKDQVEDQGAQNVTEALRYTPGVTTRALAPTPSSIRSSSGALTRRAISMACGCRSIPTRPSRFRASKPTGWSASRC